MTARHRSPRRARSPSVGEHGSTTARSLRQWHKRPQRRSDLRTPRAASQRRWKEEEPTAWSLKIRSSFSKDLPIAAGDERGNIGHDARQPKTAGIGQVVWFPGRVELLLVGAQSLE